MKIIVKEPMFIDMNFLDINDGINISDNDAHYLIKIGKAVEDKTVVEDKKVVEKLVDENKDVEEFKDKVINREANLTKKINKKAAK